MAVDLISELIEYKDEERIRLGMMSSHRWRMDPKVLLFTMSRHKFVAKMLSGKAEALDIGCGDGWGAQIVLQEVGSIRGYDVDPLLVEECQANIKVENLSFNLWDFCSASLAQKAPAAYAMDVLEHIEASREDTFLSNVAASLTPDGVCIMGMPSLESQKYASVPSQKGHVNCKSGLDLRATLSRHFQHVFMFSMNDEVVHTGFFPMANYLIGLCVGPRS